MAIHTGIIDWSVWVQLDGISDLELIILKGHLILEVLVDEVINNFLSKESTINCLNLSYSKKIKLMYLLSKDDYKDTDKINIYLIEINQIRNKLAHNYKFSEEKSGISKWANNVLSDFPVNKNTKFTYRTKVVHGFSTLSRVIYELSLVRNPTLDGTELGNT
jgi:hypothetical protein